MLRVLRGRRVRDLVPSEALSTLAYSVSLRLTFGMTGRSVVRGGMREGGGGGGERDGGDACLKNREPFLFSEEHPC